MKMQKRIELFLETCTKYLRGLYDLKRSFWIKVLRNTMQFERSLIIFWKGGYGSNRIVHD